jgi:hypothetical protein
MDKENISPQEIKRHLEVIFDRVSHRFAAKYTFTPYKGLSDEISALSIDLEGRILGYVEIHVPTVGEGGSVSFHNETDEMTWDNAPELYWGWQNITSEIQRELDTFFAWLNPMIEEEEITTEAAIGDGEVKLLPGYPKTRKTQDRWRESFQCILDLREEFREQFEEGYTENPDPSLDDCREALASMSIWKKRPSASTVSRIMKYGDEGLLG